MASTKARRLPGAGIHTRVRDGEVNKLRQSRARRKATMRKDHIEPATDEELAEELADNDPDYDHDPDHEAPDEPAPRRPRKKDWRFR